MDDLLAFLAACGMPFLFVAFPIIVMALFAFVAYRQRQKMIEKWEQLAIHTGLTLERGSWLEKPRVSGEYRRHPIELTTYTRRHGKSSTTYTLITLTVPSGGRMLRISPSGALREAIGKALGMQDVQIGNEEFDKNFNIKSHPPEFAAELLEFDVILREDIAGMRSSGWFELALDSQKLTYREVGTEMDPDRLEALFNILSSLADKIDGHSGEGF